MDDAATPLSLAPDLSTSHGVLKTACNLGIPFTPKGMMRKRHCQAWLTAV